MAGKSEQPKAVDGQRKETGGQADGRTL